MKQGRAKKARGGGGKGEKRNLLPCSPTKKRKKIPRIEYHYHHNTRRKSTKPQSILPIHTTLHRDFLCLSLFQLFLVFCTSILSTSYRRPERAKIPSSTQNHTDLQTLQVASQLSGPPYSLGGVTLAPIHLQRYTCRC